MVYMKNFGFLLPGCPTRLNLACESVDGRRIYERDGVKVGWSPSLTPDGRTGLAVQPVV